MIDIDKFIKESVTGREHSMFLSDIEINKDQLSGEIKGKKVLVIGGAGSIGSSYIKAILPFRPSSLTVVDLNENGLAELTRDLRSTEGMFVPEDYVTYTLDFSNEIFRRIFEEKGGFDIVANFSAHKHVRSEKDKWAVEALIENNVLKARRLLDLLEKYPPSHFFCVSTDKAANPVNIMGASKRVMEDLIMAYNDKFKVTTARFANVAFSNGSLPAGWIERLSKHQPLAAPTDVKRYFVSPEESGQICMLASILGRSGEIFYPKLDDKSMITFSTICDRFIETAGYQKVEFADDESARKFAARMDAESQYWPVVYFKSDTTGEKDFEEFFVPGEKLDTDRFNSLGVILESPRRPREEVNRFLDNLEDLFKGEFTKEDVVRNLTEYLPNFEHEEKGKNLDQKM